MRLQKNTVYTVAKSKRHISSQLMHRNDPRKTSKQMVDCHEMKCDVDTSQSSSETRLQ